MPTCLASWNAKTCLEIWIKNISQKYLPCCWTSSFMWVDSDSIVHTFWYVSFSLKLIVILAITRATVVQDKYFHWSHTFMKFTWCHRYHMCHVNRDSLTHCSQGSVAQLVEQRTSNPKVVGSNPTWATEFFNNSVGHFSVGYRHWCCPEDGSNIESKHWLHPGEIVSLHDVTGITCAM